MFVGLSESLFMSMGGGGGGGGLGDLSFYLYSTLCYIQCMKSAI